MVRRVCTCSTQQLPLPLQEPTPQLSADTSLLQGHEYIHTQSVSNFLSADWYSSGNGLS